MTTERTVMDMKEFGKKEDELADNVLQECLKYGQSSPQAQHAKKIFRRSFQEKTFDFYSCLMALLEGKRGVLSSTFFLIHVI